MFSKMRRKTRSRHWISDIIVGPDDSLMEFELFDGSEHWPLGAKNLRWTAQGLRMQGDSAQTTAKRYTPGTKTEFISYWTRRIEN
jgi:hypothetical protein